MQAHPEVLRLAALKTGGYVGTQAPLLPGAASLRAWILTDGKIGDLVQCEGVADCMGLRAERRTVRPGAPWSWLMPWGPIDPREGPRRPQSPIAGEAPDIVIASGRRTVPYVRRLRRGGRTFTVFLKDPRTGAGTADVVWVPEHDRLRGENVVVTLTSPHRIRAGDIEAVRAAPPADVAGLPGPRLCVLLGGPNALYDYGPETVEDLAARLRQAAAGAGGILLIASRRTPEALLAAAEGAAADTPHLVWRGEGSNPYLSWLAMADVVIVTGDSANMIGEALCVGRPVLLYRPNGREGRITTFHRLLLERGLVREFSGALETFASAPLDATAVIAADVAERFRAWRAARGGTGNRAGE